MNHLKNFKLFESYENEWSKEEVRQILENPDEAKNPFLGMDKRSANMLAFSLLVKMSEMLHDYMDLRQFLNLMKYTINIDDIELATYIISSAKEIFDNLSEPKYKKVEYIFDKHYFPNHFYKMFSAKKNMGIYNPEENEKDVEKYIKSIDPKTGPVKKLVGKELEAAINNAIEKEDWDELKILSDMLPDIKESLKNKKLRKIGTFKLFESNYRPHNWNRDDIEQILNDPENAPNPFESSSVIGDQETLMDIKNLVKGFKNLGFRITPHQFLNTMKYLVMLDNPKIGLTVLGDLMMQTEYFSQKEYVLLTHYFDRHYFPERLERMVNSKIEKKVYNSDLTLHDLDSYVDEIDQSTLKLEIKPDKLSGKELENAINAALESGDFAEAKRLSAMMESKTI